MKKVVINNREYELVNDTKEAFDLAVVESALTDYYDEYDYVVGDWAYGKLRLKGFNEKENKNFKRLNDASKIDEYIERNCAYGCKWFTIKKVK